jgi:archaellum biogenesis protein FlaJ (TadC family)
MIADGERLVKQRQEHREEQNMVILMIVVTVAIISTAVALFLVSEPKDPTIIQLGIAFAAAIVVVGLLYKPANRSHQEEKRCAHCDGLNHVYARYCQWCGFSLEAPT